MRAREAKHLGRIVKRVDLWRCRMVMYELFYGRSRRKKRTLYKVAER